MKLLQCSKIVGKLGLIYKFALLSGLGLIISCSQPTEKELVENLIIQYAKENIADCESFEIVELSEIDSLFTKLLEQEELFGYMDKFKENITEIQKIKSEIERVNVYLKKMQPFLDDAKSQESMAFFGLNEHLGYNRYGGEKRGITLNSMSRYEKAQRYLEDVKNKMGEAKSYLNELYASLNLYKDLNSNICNNTIVFCDTFKPRYIGKSVVLKCRYKDNDGNMKLENYNVLVNDSLTSIINLSISNPDISTTEIEDFIHLARNNE